MSEFRKALVATVLLLVLDVFIVISPLPELSIFGVPLGLIIIFVSAAIYVYAIIKLARTSAPSNDTTSLAEKQNVEAGFQIVQEEVENSLSLPSRENKASSKGWSEALTSLVDNALKNSESNVELTIGIPSESRVFGEKVPVEGKLKIKTKPKENVSEIKVLAEKVEELSRTVQQLLGKEPKREEEQSEDKEETVPLY